MKPIVDTSPVHPVRDLADAVPRAPIAHDLDPQLAALIAQAMVDVVPRYKQKDPPTANAEEVKGELRARRKANFERLHGAKV